MCKQDCLEPCSALKSLNGIVSALRLEIPFVLSKCELPPLFYDSRPMSSIQYLRHIKAKIDAVESPVARKLQKLFRNASCVRGYSHQRLPNLHQVLPKCLQLGFSCLDAYNHIEAAGARLERGWVLFLLTRLSSRGRVELPAFIRDALWIGLGDKVRFAFRLERSW